MNLNVTHKIGSCTCVGITDELVWHCVDRCTEQVKSSQYLDLAHDLEIDKAIMFLKQKDFNQVWCSDDLFYNSQINGHDCSGIKYFVYW